jgi:hypothetical protein
MNKYIGRVWAEFIWLIRYIPTIFPLWGEDPEATYILFDF